jgi:hypothetical protein
MEKITTISLLLILILISGCTVESYNYGRQKDQENYKLLEYYDMSEDRIYLNVGDQVIASLTEGEIVKGKIVDIRKTYTTESEISIITKKRITTFKSSEIEHLQIIETTYNKTVLFTISGMVFDAAMFGVFLMVSSINDMW